MRPESAPVASIPPGQRVYAIGDVHGRFDLLMALLDRIKADDRQRSEAETNIILLGDLIDRGPASAHVLEYLRVQQQRGFANFHFVVGNHEEAMLASLADGAFPEHTGWLDFGGRETMRSYGADDALFLERGPELAAAMRAHIPATHITFLESFKDRMLMGDYLFVHAGIRPSVPIDQQRVEDMRWIREPFLEDERDHGVVVIHGHSQCAEPELRVNRIGIDTGAYRTGILTAVGLENDSRWFLAEGRIDG